MRSQGLWSELPPTHTFATLRSRTDTEPGTKYGGRAFCPSLTFRFAGGAEADGPRMSRKRSRGAQLRLRFWNGTLTECNRVRTEQSKAWPVNGNHDCEDPDSLAYLSRPRGESAHWVPPTPTAAVSQPGTTDPADSPDSPPAPWCLWGAIPIYFRK
jgi:hypothetical protein